MPQFDQRLNVAHTPDTARRDTARNAYRVGQSCRRLNIRTPAQHAVARNIRKYDRRHPGIFKSPSQINRRDLANLRPAFNRHLSQPRIDPHHDACRVSSRCVPNQSWIAQRNGPEDHAINSELQPLCDRLPAANAATQLDRQSHGLPDRTNRRLIDRATLRNTTVQIHAMQPAEPGSFENSRLFPWGQAGMSAQRPSPPGAVAHIAHPSGRWPKQDHGRHDKKFDNPDSAT